MHSSQMHYLPLAPAFFAMLVGILLVVVVLIQIRVLRYAYLTLGVSPGAAMLLLTASLIGSYINIPVAHLPGRVVQTAQEVTLLGMRYYVVPVVEQWPGTVIAVNVGGAVIPGVLSFYLLARHELWVRGAVATAIIAAVMHMLATPVPGVGIAVPIFVQPIATAMVALVLTPHHAAPLAYISGSLGTLIGADLL